MKLCFAANLLKLIANMLQCSMNCVPFYSYGNFKLIFNCSYVHFVDRLMIDTHISPSTWHTNWYLYKQNYVSISNHTIFDVQTSIRNEPPVCLTFNVVSSCRKYVSMLLLLYPFSISMTIFFSFNSLIWISKAFTVYQSV